MRLLKLNSRGDDVAKWQQFLIDSGFKSVTADGFFGPATEAATIAFQKKRRLTVDGVVGNEALARR